MHMANFTPLSRPSHNLIAVDPNPRDSLSDGFNYPTFHLLNKQARVYLSAPHEINPIFSFRLLAVANSKGWFAAVRKEGHTTSIILSTLQELRTSLRNAKENDENLFVPRRTIRLPAQDVNIIAFGMHDARLLVGFTGGQLLVYDTAQLFTTGTNDVGPLNMSKTSSAPFLQMLPNPGAEPDLAQLVAVIRGDGTVQVIDINKLEVQCGWAGEGEAVPVAISWAPKGKHLAIGLRLGDIITYALSNNTVPHKQIPPTADGYLISLDWIGPTLVFKTTYSSKIPESSDATLHIVHADVKTSTGHYFSLMHPFPAADRNKMHALVLSVSKWDEDPSTQPENVKGLVVVGDMSSVDLEVLAYIGSQWYQQSQENPLQLPLDKNTNDTVLMSLETDLTDLDAGVPVMYAYLNDGTLQGWKFDHHKPYIGIVKSEPVPTFNGPVVAQESPAFSAFSPPSTPTPFGQGPSAFSQTTSSFAQQSPGSFGQQPAFGQTSFTQPPSFGGVATNNAFGQPSFGFGGSQPSTPQAIIREASMSDETSLGGLSLSDEQTSKSGGGGIFGSFSPPSSSASAFGGAIKPASGFGAFSNYQSTTPSITNNDVLKSPFATPSTTPGQPAFGQTGFAKPAFGQPSFGQPSFGKTTLPTSTATGSGFGAFGTPSKPATAPTTGGFGAFASNAPTAFGTPQTTTLASEPPKASPFGSPSGSAFGRGFVPAQTSVLSQGTTFAENKSFKPSVARESPPSSPEPMAGVKGAVPVDDDMSPPASPIKRDTPLSTTPAQPPPVNAFSNLSTPVRPASGFGAFGGISETSPFFKKAGMPTTPTALLSRQPVSTTPATPPPNPAAPRFGATSLPGAKSAFPSIGLPTTQAQAPASGGFSAFSGTSGSFTSFASGGKSFSELLKAKDEGPSVDKDKGGKIEPEQTKEPDTLATPTKEEQPSAVETPKMPIFAPPNSATTTPMVEPPQKMAETPKTPVFAPPPKPATTTPAEAPPQKMTDKGKAKEEDPPARKPLSSDESFVEITVEEGEIPEEEAGPKEVKEEDENEGYLSGSLSPSDSEGSIDGSSEEEDGEEEEEEEEEEGELEEVPIGEDTVKPSQAAPVEPATIPLPVSRSPSATPETPSIEITAPNESTEKTSLPLHEPSTTPPGTPAVPTSVFPKSTSSTTPAGQPFNLGLGRPSTRPMRSSPLAGVPVLGQVQVEETMKEARKPKTEVTEPRTTPSPKPAPVELPVKTDEVKETSPRPKTPPLLTTRSTPTQIAAPVPSTPVKEPTASFSLGRTGAAQHITTPAQVGSLGRESMTPQALPSKSFFPGTGGTSFFGTPPRPISSPLTFPPSSSGPAELNRPASVPPSFAKPQTASFTIKGANGAPSVFGKPQMSAPAKPSPPEVQVEEGLQRECALLYNTMNQELEGLRQLAQEASKKRQELGKSSGGSRRKADLGDASKWGLVDVQHFRQVLRQYSRDLLELRESRADLKQKVRQIGSRMLKAGTRKEEIARFTKAQNDKEFAKMLKSRTLGPEHLETQTQLRRNIRTIRDRIQKLEAHLQASKRKLAEAKSGKPIFRAPTLDTINRTYRNIDLAIQYQADDIANLSERLAKVKVTTVKALPSSQKDARLSHNDSRRPFSVTPHIAITTAAALNTERSAQKLKRALLAVRKEPLLNEKAAQATPARITFKTPQKITPNSSESNFAFKAPMSGPLFSTDTPQTPLPEWSFPEDDYNPSPSPPTRRGAGRTKKHATIVPLKKSTGSPQPPPPSFDWGPLPEFSQRPLASMETPVKLEPKFPKGFVSLTQFKR